MDISKVRHVSFILQRWKFAFFFMFNTILFLLTGRSCVGLSDLLLLRGAWLLVTFFILGNDCALAV